MKRFNHKKAFTLIELLVVIGIVLLITAITLSNYRAGERQFALQRSASKLSQDIRSAQEMAMSAKEFRGEVPNGGYGIYFNIGNPNEYILFADTFNPANYQYDGPSEEVENIKLEQEVEINSISPSSPLHVVFSPPDPIVTISGGNEAVITISLKANPSQTKTIKINAAGLIYVE